MPYIRQDDRKKYEKALFELRKCGDISTKGELEYLVFSIMQDYMKTREKRYSTLHDCVYAVEHCADEFRRRFLDKREDEAREENGDI